MRALLRSPLHGLLSGSLMLIRVTGRRTGVPRELPVMYARDGRTLWVFCQKAERKRWWRNLRESAPVTVWLRGRPQLAVGRAVQGRDEPGAALTGLRVWLARYPRAARQLGVALDSSGSGDLRSLQELAERSVLVAIQLREWGEP